MVAIISMLPKKIGHRFEGGIVKDVEGHRRVLGESAVPRESLQEQGHNPCRKFGTIWNRSPLFDLVERAFKDVPRRWKTNVDVKRNAQEFPFAQPQRRCDNKQEIRVKADWIVGCTTNPEAIEVRRDATSVASGFGGDRSHHVVRVWRWGKKCGELCWCHPGASEAGSVNSHVRVYNF
jgi:hypothetical protein